MFGLVFAVASFFISFLFPVYASFKALQVNDINLLKPWLTYWVAYASFTAFENIFGVILNLIPFYSLVRLYFQLWLVLPQTKGSVFFYHGYIAPFLKQHEQEIEAFVNNMHNNFWALLGDFKQYFGDLVKFYVFGSQKEKPPSAPLRKGYFDYLTGLYFGSSVETQPDENNIADDRLSKSYMQSLLDQFKEESGDVVTDGNAVSFVQSLLSTIPKGGSALRGDFSEQDAKNQKAPLKKAPETSVQPKDVQEDDELVDFGNERSSSSGGSLFPGMGWVKVGREKAD